MKKQIWILIISLSIIGGIGIFAYLKKSDLRENSNIHYPLCGNDYSTSGENGETLGPDESLSLVDEAKKRSEVKTTPKAGFLDIFFKAKQEEEDRFLKIIDSLPECTSPSIKPNIKIHKLEDFLTNCKKRPAEGHFVDGLGGMEPRYTAINGKIAGEDDSWNFRNPHLAYCKYQVNYNRKNADFAIASDGPSEYFRDAPAEKRAIKLMEAGIISSVNLHNLQVGPISLWGGKDFPAETPHAYAENGNHYYLIAGRTEHEIGQKVFVIDDQLYDIGKNIREEEIGGLLKQSAWSLQGFSGENIIFNRITHGRLKPEINKNNYDSLYTNKAIVDYDLESCEFPLKANPDFESMLDANTRDQNQTSTFIENKTKIRKKQLACEKRDYYKNLSGEQSYEMIFDEETHTYRVYIPELCALISTAPNYLAFSPYNNFKENQATLSLLRKGNKLYNPYLFESEKFPILIFENKELEQRLLDAVNTQAQKADPDCRLIKYENEHYLHWAKDQAQIYRYFAPQKRLGPEEENFCINKASIVENYNKNQLYKEYYLLFDARYPGMFSYAFDQGGHKQLSNNLTIFFQ